MVNNKKWKADRGILGVNSGTYNSIRISIRGTIYFLSKKQSKREKPTSK